MEKPKKKNIEGSKIKILLIKRIRVKIKIKFKLEGNNFFFEWLN
jgi:hypothetical protein